MPQQAIDAGARLDAVKLQFHSGTRRFLLQSGNNWSPRALVRVEFHGVEESAAGGLALQSGSVQRNGVWLTSSTTVAPSANMAATAVQFQPVELKTLGWALRRAALGLTLLLTVAGLSAWLLYVSIEPDETGGSTVQSDYALPPG